MQKKRHETIKNMELEEDQLKSKNSNLREELELFQNQRNIAMKALHDTLKNCRDCNKHNMWSRIGPNACFRNHHPTQDDIVSQESKGCISTHLTKEKNCP